MILLLLVPFWVAVTLAILLIPLPLIALALLPAPTPVREPIPGAGNAPFVVDGNRIIETGRCFGASIPAPLDVPAAPVAGCSFISLAVLVGFRRVRVRSSALGCKVGFEEEEAEEDMVTESFLLLGGGDWTVL